jgi:hypothetical protein
VVAALRTTLCVESTKSERSGCTAERSPGVAWTGSVESIPWCAYNDPAENMTTILTIQRANTPTRLPIFLDFWTAAYQAIDD